MRSPSKCGEHPSSVLFYFCQFVEGQGLPLISDSLIRKKEHQGLRDLLGGAVEDLAPTAEQGRVGPADRLQSPVPVPSRVTDQSVDVTFFLRKGRQIYVVWYHEPIVFSRSRIRSPN